MSLFQTKEWWSTKIAPNEEFDERHLAIGNLDNNEKQQEQIVVGSFSGFLRIYEPSQGQYQISHMKYEENFNEPIIQVLIGKLSPFSDENMLCILFFKKLIVLQFTSNQLGMTKKVLYQHGLERNAYNMVLGNFGQQPKEFICVQSCDGLLSIYEHDKFSTSSQIPNFLLPGPLSYNPITDSFVLLTASYDIECFKYSNLVSNFNSEKKLQSDWSVNIGEQSLKIECVQRNTKIFDFVAITEEAMFIISQSGVIRSQKRFEYPACNFIALPTPEKNKKTIVDPITNESLKVLTILVSSFTNHLLLYEEFQLLWATKTENISHSLQIANIQTTRGLIVTLNDEGWLQVSFLGTTAANSLNYFSGYSKEMTYDQLDKTYQSTLEKIQEKEGNGGSQKKGGDGKQQEQLNIEITDLGVYEEKEYIENKDKYFQTLSGNVIVYKLRITLSYDGQQANNIQVFFNVPQNLVVNQNPYFLNELKGGSMNSHSFEIQIYTLNDFTPYETELIVQASFHNFIPGKPINNDPRGSIKKKFLSVNSQCVIAPPIKSAAFKLTVQTNKDIPPLTELFADLLKLDINKNLQQCLTNPNAFTFILADGVDCTILISKSSNKYRIQSSKFEGIWFILSELIHLSMQHYKKKNDTLEVQFTDHVPLQDLFTVIDEHYQLRQDLFKIKDQLEKKALEFRTIQKRLLTRFKEKNPAPLNNLDILFQKSHDDIIAIANKQEHTQNKLKKISQVLCVTLHLIHFLLKLRFNLSKDTFKLIKDTIPARIVNDSCEIGWEEITNANIVYLLKVALKKEKKGQKIQIEKIEDYQKFKKQMMFLFDKLSKNAL